MNKLGKLLSLLLCQAALLLAAWPVLAQADGPAMANHWYFATRVGMKFASGQAVPSGCGRMVTGQGTASVSHPRSGQLLFYSDGRTVWHRQHRPMANGQGLLGGGGQAALPVPVPGSDSLFYLFTLQTPFALNFGGPPVDPAQTGFYYSLVDLRAGAASDGLGAVTRKNVRVAGGELTEKLTGTAHANGRDYWVLIHRLNSNEFVAWPVTAAGVGAPVVSAVGSPHVVNPSDPLSYTWAGQMKLSPNGRQLACAVTCRNSCPFEVFDFDPATGRVANPRQLDRLALHSTLSYSPDNTKLYLSANLVLAEGDFIVEGRLIQYDFAHSPPRRTFITIGGEPNGASSGGILQLGPDGRLYAQPASLEDLYVIHYPNRAGNACQLRHHHFNFLAGHPEGLGQARRNPSSYYPNYMDHIFQGLEATEWVEGGPARDGELVVYPNPTTGVVHLSLPGAAGDCGPARPGQLGLYNAVGQTLSAGLSADFSAGPVRWDLGGLAAGLYLARVEVGGRVWVRKVVVLPRE
jgi:hypothetical protein